jgi:sugar lactone lactonase YvrE
VADGTTRFNDGGCDPKGRFFAGSMALPELKDGKKRGGVWRWVNDFVYLECSPLVPSGLGLVVRTAGI